MRRRSGIVLLLVLVVLATVTVRLFVRPPSGSVPAEADAVALLSGGSGDRLPRAVALVRRGAADVLVIPNGTDPTWAAANALCRGDESFEVVCPRPDPDSTRGEARSIDDIARDLGWDRVVVVTSRYHVTRARMLLERCVKADVTVVASRPASGPLRWTRYVLHEALGLFDTVVLDRGC